MRNLLSRKQPAVSAQLHKARAFCDHVLTRLIDITRISLLTIRLSLKGLVHDNAHARRLSLQNKFVGSTLNSKSPLLVQSLKILRFIWTSVALAGLVILR